MSIEQNWTFRMDSKLKHFKISEKFCFMIICYSLSISSVRNFRKTMNYGSPIVIMDDWWEEDAFEHLFPKAVRRTASEITGAERNRY